MHYPQLRVTLLNKTGMAKKERHAGYTSELSIWYLPYGIYFIQAKYVK